MGYISIRDGIIREFGSEHVDADYEGIVCPRFVVRRQCNPNPDWIIVGGESGPGARPMAEEWVIDIRDQCHAKCVPFFFKQWGGVQKKRAGRLLQGKTWDQMPALPRLATV